MQTSTGLICESGSRATHIKLFLLHSHSFKGSGLSFGFLFHAALRFTFHMLPLSSFSHIFELPVIVTNDLSSVLTMLYSLAPGPESRVVDKSTIELDNYIIEPVADDEEDQYNRQRHVYYRSEKLLGHLYRAIDEQRIWHEDVRSKVPAADGSSFWDDFFIKTRPRYEAIVDDPRGWVGRLDTAREIRGWYEEAVSAAMGQYSAHPTKPLMELEVFIGSILNKSGVQTHRQRDSSIKLKDEMDRIASWITGQMRKVSHDPEVTPLTGYQTQFDNLHLCLACVHAGCEETVVPRESRFEGMQSFRVVAACALLSEISLFENGQQRNGGAGGFVGVSGGRRNAAAAMNGMGRYSMVPPPVDTLPN